MTLGEADYHMTKPWLLEQDLYREISEFLAGRTLAGTPGMTRERPPAGVGLLGHGFVAPYPALPGAMGHNPKTSAAYSTTPRHTRTRNQYSKRTVATAGGAKGLGRNGWPVVTVITDPFCLMVVG